MHCMEDEPSISMVVLHWSPKAPGSCYYALLWEVHDGICIWLYVSQQNMMFREV